MTDRFDPSALRYAVASAAALGLDLVLTMALRALTDLSLTVCAAIGFVTIGVLFYFVHEFWTFRREASAWSAKRLVKNLIVLACGFTGRVSTIGVLEWLAPPSFLLGFVYFGLGVAVSFSINYFANKHLVFEAS